MGIPASGNEGDFLTAHTTRMLDKVGLGSATSTDTGLETSSHMLLCSNIWKSTDQNASHFASWKKILEVHSMFIQKKLNCCP
jgi:uncharacterized protein YfaT (DUF1175 family)